MPPLDMQIPLTAACVSTSIKKSLSAASIKPSHKPVAARIHCGLQPGAPGTNKPLCRWRTAAERRFRRSRQYRHQSGTPGPPGRASPFVAPCVSSAASIGAWAVLQGGGAAGDMGRCKTEAPRRAAARSLSGGYIGQTGRAAVTPDLAPSGECNTPQQGRIGPLAVGY